MSAATAQGGCCVPSAPNGCAATAQSQLPQPHRLQTSHEHAFITMGGGLFCMGSDAVDCVPGDGEGPARDVCLSPFGLAATTVTNAQFSAFVRATQHVTDAERLGSSFVFRRQLAEPLRHQAQPVSRQIPWWSEVPDACWQRPEGPGSHIAERANHPVVHVSWNDAQAYCHWAACRLPSEAEWEFAARGGMAGKRYSWGDDSPFAPSPRCNIWQGEFPDAPALDWPVGTVAVRQFEPNHFGFYNMLGNVWEWCEDWFDPAYHGTTSSFDPLQQKPSGQRSLRGGSFLCHDSYCNRYRVSARTGNTASTTASNIGFRVARS